jgi:hypothetical protein
MERNRQTEQLPAREISAVETYRWRQVDREHGARRAAGRNPATRSAMQGRGIVAAGARAARARPGARCQMVEGAAKTLGARPVSALEEGEDHGLKDYKSDVNDVDPSCRQIVGRMISMQQQTHDRLSALKRRL